MQMQIENEVEKEEMHITESMRSEEITFRGIPRVLVCYYRPTLTEQEYLLVRQLIPDLRSAGIDIALRESNDLTKQFSPSELQQCQWILLLSTADSEHSAQLEKILVTASTLSERQEVLQVLISSMYRPVAVLNASMLTTFDLSGDYARALASIVLKINPDHQTSLYRVKRGSAPPPVHRPKMSAFSIVYDRLHVGGRSVGRHNRLPFWLITLTTLLILGVIVTNFIVALQRVTVHPTVTHTAQVLPQPMSSARPFQMLYTRATSGTPAIAEPFQAQDTNNWTIAMSAYGSCMFGPGSAYYVQAMHPPASDALPMPYKRTLCLANTPTFSNFAFQVDMKLVQGSVGGIVFRAQGLKSYYWFSLDSRGCYELVFASSLARQQFLSPLTGNCLNLDMQTTKQLTVIAQGTQIDMYVDGQPLLQVHDANLSSGQLGMLCIDRPNNPMQGTQAAFTHLKVWKL